MVENSEEIDVEGKTILIHDNSRTVRDVLAHYKKNDNLSKAPRRGNSIEIKSMLAGEVRVYNSFGLRGNDIVIISTSKDARGNPCVRRKRPHR